MKVTFIKTLDKSKTKKKTDNSENGIFKTIIKKNQVSLFAIALMLVASGYLNYTNNLKMQVASLGDATLVSTNAIEEKQMNQEMNENQSKKEDKTEENKDFEEKRSIEKNEEENKIKEENEIKEETKQVGNEISDKEYFSKIKLDRDTMYSQMIETYQKILEDPNIQDEQKKISAEEIKKLNNKKNAILTIENLIKVKNIKDAAVLINDQIIDVVIKKNENLTEEETAQISNIVSRELNADIENIHITFHK